jgi:hypothetical protein
MHRVIQDSDMELLFTQGCHHRKLKCRVYRSKLLPERN